LQKFSPAQFCLILAFLVRIVEASRFFPGLLATFRANAAGVTGQIITTINTQTFLLSALLISALREWPS
jgi:hypothetical protein